MHFIARFREEDKKEQLAFLSGLVHDYGKYSAAWQQYLADGCAGRKQAKKDHATAGVLFATEPRTERAVGLQKKSGINLKQ
jgi:hypothetical protein